MNNNVLKLIQTLDVLVQVSIGAAVLTGVFDTGAAFGLICLLGWQLLSMVCHMIMPQDRLLQKVRRTWGIALGIYTAITAFTAVTVILFMIAFVLTWMAGFLFTLPYFIICMAELATMLMTVRPFSPEDHHNNC